MIHSLPADSRIALFQRFLPSMTQQEACQNELSYLLARIEGASVSLLATVDGRVVMHASNRENSLARLAAIASSLCALGETLAKEIGQHDCRNVLIETPAGHSAVRRLSAPVDSLILLTASNKETNLGALLTYSRMCAEAIASIATSTPR